VRLRLLTEAECYARCYGGPRSEQVSLMPARAAGRVAQPRPPEQFDRREREPEEEAA